MKKYSFTSEEAQEIRAAREKNRDKNVDRRLAALEMRAEGKRNKEISEKTGFHTQYITVLVSRYKSGGLASITENHYHGNRRNLSYAEEEVLLEPFRQDAKAGKVVSVHDMVNLGFALSISTWVLTLTYSFSTAEAIIGIEIPIAIINADIFFNGSFF